MRNFTSLKKKSTSMKRRSRQNDQGARFELGREREREREGNRSGRERREKNFLLGVCEGINYKE